jgi:hypothetical protein
MPNATEAEIAKECLSLVIDKNIILYVRSAPAITCDGCGVLGVCCHEPLVDLGSEDRRGRWLHLGAELECKHNNPGTPRM